VKFDKILEWYIKIDFRGKYGDYKAYLTERSNVHE
jgi:hypothetical protein